MLTYIPNDLIFWYVSSHKPFYCNQKTWCYSSKQFINFVRLKFHNSNNVTFLLFLTASDEFSSLHPSNNIFLFLSSVGLSRKKTSYVNSSLLVSSPPTETVFCWLFSFRIYGSPWLMQFPVRALLPHIRAFYAILVSMSMFLFFFNVFHVNGFFLEFNDGERGDIPPLSLSRKSHKHRTLFWLILQKKSIICEFGRCYPFQILPSVGQLDVYVFF